MRTPRPPRPLIAVFRVPMLLGAGVVLLSVPASAAHAQFGKLVKRAAAAAAEAAIGDAAAKAGAPTGRSADASQLEITAERLDAFVAGMAPALEGARAAEARRAARRDLEARAEDYEACKTRAEAELGAAIFDTSPAGLDRAATVGNLMSDVGQRHAAAQAAGDARRTAVLGDSLELLADAMMEAQTPALVQRCGRKPKVPARAAGHDDGGASLRPAVPAGMTPVQFGVMRERVAAWLVANGVGASLSPAESAALESRREALAPLVPFFRDRSLEWVNVLGGLEPTP